MPPNNVPVTARPWWMSQGRRQDGSGGATSKRRPAETGGGRRGVGMVSLGAWQQQLEQLARLQLARAPADWRRIDHVYSPQHLRARLEKIAAGRPGATVAWPKELALWHIPHDLSMRLSPPSVSPPGGDRVRMAMGGGEVGLWFGRGLGACAALAALLLLLLRAADSKFANAIFKFSARRRRHSEEWPTPNVIATSLAVRIPMEGMMGRPPSPPPSQRMRNDLHLEMNDIDLPPPYSSCADPDSAGLSAPKPPEEPPPPYSACYVTYSNSKDRPPSVQIFPGSSTDRESAQMARITVSPLDSDDDSVIFQSDVCVEPRGERPGTPVPLAVGEAEYLRVRGTPLDRLVLM